jgi:hypothetical protein
VGDHHGAGFRKDLVEVFNDFRLFGFFHFALLTLARVTIRVPTLLLSICPRVQTRTAGLPPNFGFIPCLCWRILSSFA